MGIHGYRAFLAIALGAGAVSGCGPERPAEAVKPFRGMSLVVAAVGDPALPAAVKSQRGEWSSDRGAEVDIRAEPIDPKATAGVDVLVFPGDRLGDLVDSGALAVLPDDVVRPPSAQAEGATTAEVRDVLQYSDVLPAFRDQVTKYGPDRMGLPLGGSALVLAMNRVAFEGQANRDAAAGAGVSLKAPATWDDFDALAKALHGLDWSGDGSADFGVALALGPDPGGLADATYLARAAAAGQHRDQYSFLFDSDAMLARIASPPFVEALQKLAALAPFGPPGMAGFDAEAAREAFRSGKVAMLVDRAEMASSWGEANRIDVAPLPGSIRVYDPARKDWEDTSAPNRPSVLPGGGGWLVGVCAATTGPRREAAVDFAKYLASPDTSGRLRSGPIRPMLATRGSQLNKGLPDPRASSGVDARAWSDAVAATLKAPRVVLGPRFPDARGYLSDLSAARVAVLNGEKAESALKAVESAWTERTARLGHARQVWHYRRSLNSLVTTPEPPPR